MEDTFQLTDKEGEVEGRGGFMRLRRERKKKKDVGEVQTSAG